MGCRGLPIGGASARHGRPLRPSGRYFDPESRQLSRHEWQLIPSAVEFGPDAFCLRGARVRSCGARVRSCRARVRSFRTARGSFRIRFGPWGTRVRCVHPDRRPSDTPGWCLSNGSQFPRSLPFARCAGWFVPFADRFAPRPFRSARTSERSSRARWSSLRTGSVASMRSRLRLGRYRVRVVGARVRAARGLSAANASRSSGTRRGVRRRSVGADEKTGTLGR